MVPVTRQFIRKRALRTRMRYLGVEAVKVTQLDTPQTTTTVIATKMGLSPPVAGILLPRNTAVPLLYCSFLWFVGFNLVSAETFPASTQRCFTGMMGRHACGVSAQNACCPVCVVSNAQFRVHYRLGASCYAGPSRKLVPSVVRAKTLLVGRAVLCWRNSFRSVSVWLSLLSKLCEFLFPTRPYPVRWP
jgi:hypothetical protein